MSTELRAHLDRLDAALAAATPGPWTPATAPSTDSDETHAQYLTNALRPDEGRPLWVAWAPVVDGLHDDSDYVVPVVTGDGPMSEANARLIAEMHANLPRLLTTVRAAAELADELDTESADYVAEADPLPTTNPRRGQLVARALGKKAAAVRLRTALALTDGDAR